VTFTHYDFVILNQMMSGWGEVHYYTGYVMIMDTGGQYLLAESDAARLLRKWEDYIHRHDVHEFDGEWMDGYLYARDSVPHLEWSQLTDHAAKAFRIVIRMQDILAQRAKEEEHGDDA
jgi:hypothetical protein